jgi:Kef-type K+ transport system membrane component KefB
MISRGEIGLVVSSIGITYGILSGEIYTALIIVVFITTLLPPFLLRRSYLNEPVRVSPDAVIKLLFQPTLQSPPFNLPSSDKLLGAL